MVVTTVSISDELRRKLLKLAAELQSARGEHVGYEEVIRYLISVAERDEHLLREACAPTPLTTSEFRRDLRRSRAEERGERRSLSAGTKSGASVSEAILTKAVSAYTSYLSVTEAEYILCRGLGHEIARKPFGVEIMFLEDLLPP